MQLEDTDRWRFRCVHRSSRGHGSLWSPSPSSGSRLPVIVRVGNSSSETIRGVGLALVSVYRRPDGYYLVVSAQTTTGLWLDVAEPPGVLGLTTDPKELGGAVLDRLARVRPRTPHPQRHEWPDVRRSSLHPITESAEVRSWREFVRAAALVEVGRTDGTFSVTPMKRMAKPQGAFEPDLAAQERLLSPSPASLGQVILRAFVLDGSE